MDGTDTLEMTTEIFPIPESVQNFDSIENPNPEKMINTTAMNLRRKGGGKVAPFPGGLRWGGGWS